MALFNEHGYFVITIDATLEEVRRTSRFVAPGWSVAITGGANVISPFFPENCLPYVQTIFGDKGNVKNFRVNPLVFFAA